MKPLLLASILSLLGAVPAFAHVTLETPTAPVGKSYKAVFRVPHGCSGAATTAIRVAVPEGFISAKPQPKPGWTLAIKTGDYKQAYKLYGAPVTSGTTEVDWTGGNLPDNEYDEFVLVGTIADSLPAGQKLYFPVVQECGGEAERWIMVPEAGETAEDLKTPAPALTLTPATP